MTTTQRGRVADKRKLELEVECAFCRDWFAASLDGQEGVNWFNGESNKYVGNAWDEAERILRRLKKVVGR